MTNPTKNFEKGRIEINVVLPLCLENTARHPFTVAPSIS
jgi:hypothetical protein